MQKEEEDRLRAIRTERTYINNERKENTAVIEDIKIEPWRKYFVEWLETNEKTVKDKGQTCLTQEKEKISRKEVTRQMGPEKV